MPKISTNIRLDKNLKKAVMQKCIQDEVTLTFIAEALLEKWVTGKLLIGKPLVHVPMAKGVQEFENITLRNDDSPEPDSPKLWNAVHR